MSDEESGKERIEMLVMAMVRGAWEEMMRLQLLNGIKSSQQSSYSRIVVAMIVRSIL